VKSQMGPSSTHDRLQRGRRSRRPDRTLVEPAPSERLVEAFDGCVALLSNWAVHDDAEPLVEPAEVRHQRAEILRRLRYELYALLFSPLWPYASLRRFVGYTVLSLAALAFGWLLVSLTH
jgi:hypothetical protein